MVVDQIWRVADAEDNGNLSKSQFHFALRLVMKAQYQQQDLAGTLSLDAFKKFGLPCFSGLPPLSDGWSMNFDDRIKYESLFRQLDADRDGLVSKKVAPYYIF